MRSRSTNPVLLLSPIRFSWPQPERDMRGLHRLLHRRHQFLPQLIQIHLIAQGRTESSKRPCRIILTSVEAAVNDLLDASAKRLEKGRDGQGGDDDGDAVVVADNTTQER